MLSSRMNTDKSYNFFLEKFESLLENYVHLKKISRNKLKLKDTLWVTSGLQKSLSIKKQFLTKLIRSKEPSTKGTPQNMQTIQKSLIDTIKNKKQFYFSGFKDPKNTWK